MRKLFLVLALASLAISSLAQSQGVSMRATNGIGYGNTVINNLIGKAATGSLTNASGSRVAYLSDTNGLGGSAYTNNLTGTPGTITGLGISKSLDFGSGTNYASSNLNANSQIPVGSLFAATTNANTGGFLLETINGTRYRTYNGASLTGIVAGAVSGVYASNVTSGGVLPAGTVSASTATAGYVLATDGALRQWTNRVSLGQIDGNGGTGSTNIVTGRIFSTNSSVANTFLDINGGNLAAGNVLEYKTNNVSKFSVDTAGNIVVGSVASISAGNGLSTSGGAVTAPVYRGVSSGSFTVGSAATPLITITATNVLLGNLLSLAAVGSTITNAANNSIWNSNNFAFYARKTNGVDTLLLAIP